MSFNIVIPLNQNEFEKMYWEVSKQFVDIRGVARG